MGTSDPPGTPKPAGPAFTSARPGRAFQAPPPPPPWQRVPWPPAPGRGRTQRAELPPTAARGPPARRAGKEAPCMGLEPGGSAAQGPGRKRHIWRGACRGRGARREGGYFRLREAELRAPRRPAPPTPRRPSGAPPPARGPHPRPAPRGGTPCPPRSSLPAPATRLGAGAPSSPALTFY